jgi:hypothetical protein
MNVSDRTCILPVSPRNVNTAPLRLLLCVEISADPSSKGDSEKAIEEWQTFYRLGKAQHVIALSSASSLHVSRLVHIMGVF